MNKIYLLLLFTIGFQITSSAAVIANTKLNEQQLVDIRKLYLDENFFKSGIDSVKAKYLEENYPNISHITLDKFPLLFEVLHPQSSEVYPYYEPYKDYFRSLATEFYATYEDAVDIWTNTLAIEKTDLVKENFIRFYELIISDQYLLYMSSIVPNDMIDTSPKALNKRVFGKFERTLYMDYIAFILLNSDIKLFP
jgi:hypothetical protein